MDHSEWADELKELQLQRGVRVLGGDCPGCAHKQTLHNIVFGCQSREITCEHCEQVPIYQPADCDCEPVQCICLLSDEEIATVYNNWSCQKSVINEERILSEQQVSKIN